MKWETVLLLGDPATIAAARAWHEQAWQLERTLDEDSPDKAAFIDAYKNTMRLRNEFYARARADLDVASGTLPELTWSSLERWSTGPDGAELSADHPRRLRSRASTRPARRRSSTRDELTRSHGRPPECTGPARRRGPHAPGGAWTAPPHPSVHGVSGGTVSGSVFPARHAGLRSGGMGTVSDDIGPCESTQE
ncbi:hypothetical protein [Amycolatopsis plumensis]|uniref:hypothetical protein n=1 Tax=Amycolatopsis plumensis TaxID=236508 RepID=UPI00360C20F0